MKNKIGFATSTWKYKVRNYSARSNSYDNWGYAVYRNGVKIEEAVGYASEEYATKAARKSMDRLKNGE